MQLLLILFLSTALAQNCGKVKLHIWQDVLLVYYTEFPCNSAYYYFCEGSGWGNKEATVACRELGYQYGIGGYLSGYVRGYGNIECQGNETKLEECVVTRDHQICDRVAVVSYCSNVPQVSVSQTSYTWDSQHYLAVWEDDGSIQVCLETNGVVTETVYIFVKTNHTSTTGYTPAIADEDYRSSAHILMFEPSDEMRSQQCLEIEIIDDSLPEDWEVFTLLLSTNNSAVNLTTHRVDVYIRPSDVSQVFLAEMMDNPWSGYYLTVWESEGSMKVCLQINGRMTEPLYVHVKTIHENITDTTPALAAYDYKSTIRTLKFEESDKIALQQQCVEIEIIDDSLPEDWEVFTLLLSTNNSAVNITTPVVYVYILSNDDSSCPEGSVTVVSDVNNSSLQLVEMCSSEGVWSPVCDSNWTLQDATVVCRELEKQDIADSPMYAVINNASGIEYVTYECEGNETRLSDCVTPLSSEVTTCYYALVNCFPTNDKKSGSGGSNNIDSGSSSSIVSTVTGLIVSLIAVLLVVTIVIISLIVWLKKRTKNFKPAHNNASPISKSLSPTAVSAGTEVTHDMTLLHENPSYQSTGAVLAESNIVQLQENLSYQHPTAVSAGINMMLLQENPSYQTTTAALAGIEANNMTLLQEPAHTNVQQLS